jgi:flagellar hook-basal body complex protein FliE
MPQPLPLALSASIPCPGHAPQTRSRRAGAGGFSTVLSGALKDINSAQVDASRLQQGFEVAAPGVSLEQTMVAMQKAQIGFQAAVTVRNKLVSAYTDIMNMQV